MRPGCAATSGPAVDDAERLALVTLSRLAEPGDRRLVQLVDDHGAQPVLAALRERSVDIAGGQRYRTRLDAVHADADLAHAARTGIRVVCRGDDEWPEVLDDLGPERPLVLWVRGAARLNAVARRSVAVVGARGATAYGEHVAAELASALGDRGWSVTSGAAYGIDAAAHRGALASGSPTVAVLACGVDVAYPRGNASLLARVVAEGVVVSELAPGCSVTRGRFLTRNRVIAAFTRGTVVVEAAVRSGALNTAGHALRLGRHVMAVPGPVTSAQSAGCHALLRRGPEVVLVTDAVEVLDVVGVLGEDAAPDPRGPQTPLDGLDADELRVLDALPRRRGAALDAVVRTAGLDVATVLRCVGRLRGLGLAEPDGPGWRSAAHTAARGGA